MMNDQMRISYKDPDKESTSAKRIEILIAETLMFLFFWAVCMVIITITYVFSNWGQWENSGLYILGYGISSFVILLIIEVVERVLGLKHYTVKKI